MAGLKLMAHGGFVPRVAPHLLNDNEAQEALNTKLYAGDLRSWQKPGPLSPRVIIPNTTQTIYRGKKTNSDDRWIAWSVDVDVAKSPVPGTEKMQIYYTGDAFPKKTNSTLAGGTSGTAPLSWLQMGVPGPISKPTVTRNGSGASPETRVYVYTYISEFGSVSEESAPSPTSDGVLCGSGDTVTVSGFATAPTAGYNITKMRIYRSVTGSTSTQLQFVTEVSIGTTSFTDNLSSGQLGEVIQTIGWLPPPSNLSGLVSLPAGFLAGFSGRTLCLSEINAPHAWPIKYQFDIEYDIVGLAVFGQSIVVMTKGYPYVATGVTPESVTIEKIAILEPCISKRSITSDTTGATYASPNGLVGIGPGQAGLITGNVMLRDDFTKFSPYTLRSGFFAGKYFGFFNGGSSIVTDGGFILDRNLQATPLSVTSIIANAVYVDPENGKMYMAIDNEILEWEGDPYNALPYEWKSKRFVFTSPANLGAIEVNAPFSAIQDAALLQERIAEIVAQNQVIWAAAGGALNSTMNTTTFNYYEINGSILTAIPRIVEDRFLLVSLYVDDKLIHSASYNQSGVYRLPSGYKGQDFVVKINGNIECRYVKLAETVKELKAL